MPSEWSQLPFEEAIAYFKGKTNLDTDTYADAQGITQDVAFTVAKAKGDLLNEIRVAVEKAIVSGQGLDVFQKAFDRIADRWSPDWLRNGDRAWRSQLVYETNLRSAYAAGRYTQMTQPEVLNKRPYWQWRHGGSKDPRPEHIALDGKVFDADQLFFQVGGFPPCGYNCRCRVFSMSPRDLSQRSLLVSEAPPVEAIVDKGWGFVPGKSDRSALLAGLPDEIRSLVMKDSSVKFAERMEMLTADYAGKKGGKGKKNCEKGKICKGSCIAKTKTCLGDMNPAQLKAHKAAQASARKAKAKGGGGGGTPDNVATPAIVPVVTPIVASRKNFEFPSDSDLKAAKKEPLGGDPDDTLNAKDIFTADINGQKFFIKGNSPLEKDWEGWDNIDKTTMAKQLKSEVATKEIADLVGVGEYYLPIKEYGRGRTAKVVTPFIDATPAGEVNIEKLSMHEPDRRKLLALDYALGALDRHGGNVMIDKDGKPYMIDNGLNFGKHLGRGQTNYYAWSNNSNFLKTGMNLYDEQLDRSHIQGIVNNKASIIKIAKDKGLDYKSVEKRINELDAAKTWDDIL